MDVYTILKDFSAPFIAAVAIFATFKQVGKQIQNIKDERKQTFKKQHQIKAFELISEKAQIALSVCEEVSSTVNVKKVYLENKSDLTVLNVEERLVIVKACTDTVMGLCKVLEANEIMNPLLFRTTRYALQSEHYKMVKTQFGSSEIEFLDTMFGTTNQCLCYTHDFLVCMQNEVYGELFNNTLSARFVNDPKFRVITNNPTQLYELLTHLERETCWGREVLKVRTLKDL